MKEIILTTKYPEVYKEIDTVIKTLGENLYIENIDTPVEFDNKFFKITKENYKSLYNPNQISYTFYTEDEVYEIMKERKEKFTSEIIKFVQNNENWTEYFEQFLEKLS